jgi:hypothetical protein
MDNLEDIFKEEDKVVAEPIKVEPPFNKFCKLFKENWAIEEVKIRTDLKRFKMFYKETHKGIEVYKVSENTKIAFFYEHDSWVDNRELMDMLRYWMPQYQPYFQRKRNLVSEAWMR